MVITMDLSKLLAFHRLVAGKTEEETKEFAVKFGIDYDEYLIRIKGKEKEAEFAVILKSLSRISHLNSYDEGISHLTNEYTPDYEVTFDDGYKLLVEVKSTQKDRFQISMGNLKKRIEFANQHNLPLRFAVSLKGYWGLFTTDDIIEHKGKLTIEDFGGEKSISWLDRELETCSYMFPKDVMIRSVYSKNRNAESFIKHEQFGTLISYELYCGGKKIFRLKGRNSRYNIYSVYLEALQNRLANSKQDIALNGDITIISEKFCYDDSIHIIPEYEFLIAPISHTIREDNVNVKYDSMSAIAQKDYVYLDVKTLRVILCDLVKKGINIIVYKGNNGYHFDDYRREYWTK